MATVTIHDEATGRVLESCVWRAAHRRLGESTWDSLWAMSQDVALGEAGDTDELEQVLDTVSSTLSVLQAVRNAKVGEAVLLDLSDEEWREAIEGVRYAIEEGQDGAFFRQPAETRIEILATRDAALALAIELHISKAASEAVA